MSSRQKILIAVVVIIVLGGASAISLVSTRERGVEVRMEEVATRDLVATVTASGNIRARRTVDISSDVMGRVIEMNVEEGDDVVESEILLRIDPTQFEAAVGRAVATLSQARAGQAQQHANLVRAQRDYDRNAGLWRRDSVLVSRQVVEDAETNLEVAQSLFEAAEFGVAQSQAALEEAEDQLAKTIILAPMDGKVTRLQVEQGETVVIGTMNNPGSLILTISDLSVVEAVVEVDETDIPDISLGDSALVELDAFRDLQFVGRVTEIGNSAIIDPSSMAGTGQTAAIDFEVVITIDDPPVELRPDLSATADIITAIRQESIAIPIIALTVREADDESNNASSDEDDSNRRRPEGPVARRRQEPDVEGVFVVSEGNVTFTPVEVGIAGQEYFEVLSGLSLGDTVVSGPYQRIRELHDGDPVRRLNENQ